MKKNRKKPAFLNSMENEVILAVSALYIMIVAIIITAHYIQPSEQKMLPASSLVLQNNK